MQSLNCFWFPFSWFLVTTRAIQSLAAVPLLQPSLPYFKLLSFMEDIPRYFAPDVTFGGQSFGILFFSPCFLLSSFFIFIVFSITSRYLGN